MSDDILLGLYREALVENKRLVDIITDLANGHGLNKLPEAKSAIINPHWLTRRNALEKHFADRIPAESAQELTVHSQIINETLVS
jgi:predicted Zn-dependent protease